ncbi:hypothetical protein BDN70DRAFT_870262 [Pholiota conissans]|uniref:Uncharacterized protein n=1 Tax=Pholiota conissans TaxID=109636 RepID=A0A9P6CZB0_9AGAR|nr:hypothetical protein BDN70DRAFT_870262 [Pholiota conissans]
MKSETSRPLHMLPSTIIETIIANLVHGKGYANGAKLTRLERRDLASCGLASSLFYLPSRRYLFATVTINLDLYNSRGEEIWLSRNGLVDILSGNTMLQNQVYHLVVTYMDPKSDRWMRPAGYIGAPRSDAFQQIVRFFPALRGLTIASSLPGCGTLFNVAVAFVSQELKFYCPHLRSLTLMEVNDTPIEFFHQWACITELKLVDVDLSDPKEPNVDDQGGDDDGQAEDAQKALESQRRAGSLKIERLCLHGAMYLTESLVNSLNNHHLQYLHLSFDPRVGSVVPMSQAAQLVHVVAPTLAHLSLKDAFYYDSILEFSDSVIQNVKFLELVGRDTPDTPETPFPSIASFLTPKTSNIVSKLERISISFSCSRDIMKKVFDYNQGWSALDILWTGPQYQHLAKVDIRLIFTATGSEKAILRLEHKTKILMELIKHRSYRLLPLVSCSPRIDLNFHIEVHSLTRYVAWNNRTGRASNFIL